MNSTLVTVVCNRDLWNFELQVRSISKYLAPCRIIFIYNENPERWKEFKKWYALRCEPLLKKFEVKLFRKDSLFFDYNLDSMENRLFTEPIYDQQLIKLFVSEYVITENYTVIDCKNFFTKPCRISDIKQTKPENLEYADDKLYSFVIACAAKLGVRYTGRKNFLLSSNITPFIMKKKSVQKLIKHFKGKAAIHQWMLEWCNTDSNMAEFYLYEVFTKLKGIQDPGGCLSNTVTVWEHCFWFDENNDAAEARAMTGGLDLYVRYEESLIEKLGQNVYVCGIHTHTREYIDPKDIKKLLAYYKMEDCWPRLHCPFKKTKSDK